MRWVTLFILVIFHWFAATAFDIYRFSQRDDAQPADVAIVLGAGTFGDQPSPLFAARIDHAIELYQRGVVKKLIMSGGRGSGGGYIEGEVAYRYAQSKGVPAKDILYELRSRITYENLLESKLLMETHGLHTALIVSDPLHMKRAMVMAGDLGINAHSSPTPTTMLQTWKTKRPFLWRETGLLFVHYLRIPVVLRPTVSAANRILVFTFY